jgi:F-type H+-transporting ATPase subunit b
MSGLVDIKLVLTQILGFLILVWILGRYAWGPVVASLEARRQKIAGEFADADRRKADADQLRAKYEQELRGVEALKRQGIQDGVAEGQRIAAEIRAQAQTEAQERLARAQDEVMREREKAKELLKEQVISLSLRTAEKILREKLDDPAQRRLASQFIEEIGAQ